MQGAQEVSPEIEMLEDVAWRLGTLNSFDENPSFRLQYAGTVLFDNRRDGRDAKSDFHPETEADAGYSAYRRVQLSQKVGW